jgi:ABC-type dipeptide/oligopeptide/nickel transport system permease subunit
MSARLPRYAALIAVACVGVAVVVAQRFWLADAYAQNPAARLLDPSLAHPLGTDNFGRDLLARLLLGAQWSLSGAAVVCAGTSILGFAIGAVAATGNRTIDDAIGRTVEALLAMPGLVLALALSAILGPSFPNLIVALVVTSWPSYARLSRALILKERNQQYVEGAVASGATQLRIVARHVLPNVVGPAVVLATSDFGKVILGLASLSFLGLGMQPPTPEWGAMINEARGYFQSHPWQMMAPGLCILVTVLTVNLVGDAVRDALDPRTRRRITGAS